MPRLVKSVPSYRKHRATGQAVVTLAGRDHYLGRHGTKASVVEYDRLVGEWLANFRQAQRKTPDDVFTVVQLVAAYWSFAKQYYRRDGEPTSSLIRVRIALRLLRRAYGSHAVADFGPLALRAMQDRLAGEGKSRRYVNHLTQQLKRVFKWGVSHQLVPVAVYQALATVEGLRKGRSAARETSAVLPVPAGIVEQTLPHLSKVVSDMVQLQRLTGCRPGEICSLRPCDIDKPEVADATWIYRPEIHKTRHHDKVRQILVGPQAQAILQQYLDRPPTAFCFSPAESEARRRAAKSGQRKTPDGYGNRPGTNRKEKPTRYAGPRYTTTSYLRAVVRACEVAFEMPKGIRVIPKAVPKEVRSQLLREARTWRAQYCWHPNQLRHSAATEIRRRFGLEAAQVILGHSTANVTEIYAERDIQLAHQVMREIG